MLQNDYDNFVKAALTLATTILIVFGPVVAAYVTRLLKLKGDEAMAKAKETLKGLLPTGWEIDEVAESAVLAAEQLWLNNQIQDKKAWAVDLVDDWLKRRGITLPVHEIETLIEAKVFEELNKDKKVKKESELTTFRHGEQVD